MKKKIFRFIAILVILVAVGSVIYYIRLHREQDETGISKYYESSSEVRYSPGSEYNFTTGGEDVIMEGCTHKFVIEAEVIRGSITFNMYRYDKPNEKKGELLRSEHISETGEYTYSLDDLPAGSYWFEISEDSEETTANAKYKFCRERID